MPRLQETKVAKVQAWRLVVLWNSMLLVQVHARISLQSHCV
jgi:hypothetical protein